MAPFCVEPGKSKCAADHRGYGTCNIGQVSDAVPNEYRNFDEGKNMELKYESCLEYCHRFKIKNTQIQTRN